ncbi:hypothetical protein SUDANB121_03867 [Nocardiopsis dassonvillei]|uniref:hypothetical protein n=1 Tax=Nocardiopsis dassonvillei TaxID=2014 RepID=UPI003F56D602
MQRGSGSPRDFWEREQGFALRSVSPAAAPAPSPAAPAPAAGPRPHARPPAGPFTGPPPTGPPARVGGTVAALVVAVLTLVPPVLLGAYTGLWFLFLGVNVPGIALAAVGLTKIPDADEVERYLRYTWACNLAYAVLDALLVGIGLFVLLLIIALGY